MTTSDAGAPGDRVLQFADRMDGRFALWAGPLGTRVEDGLRQLERDAVMRRLYAREPALWSPHPAVQEKIANRLGWLTAPDWVMVILLVWPVLVTKQ